MLAQHEFRIRTEAPGAHDFSEDVAAFVARSGIERGLLTLFVRHSSASLLVQENYDPDVMADMERFFRRLVPPGDPLFRHTAEGPDDMPAHVRSALTQTSLAIPVSEGKMVLGTWQGIWLYEHRDRPHDRRIFAHLQGES